MKSRLFIYFQIVFICYITIFLIEYFSIGFVIKIFFISQSVSLSIFIFLLILINPLITYGVSEKIMKKIEKK